MKKIISVIVGICVFACVKSQTTCDEKGISTNPSSPDNNEKPSAENQISWLLPAANPNFTCYPYGYPSYPILSPWHVSDPVFNYYDLAKGTNSDYKYEDGWELLKINLGKFLDNSTDRVRTVKIPYMMLYNRYQGVIRMFASLRDPGYTYKTVVVKFEMPKGNLNAGQPTLMASTVLSLHGETAQPLDQETGVTTVRVPTYFPNNENYFFWVDVPVAYDPCVCQHPGQINVAFEFYDQADIKMEGVINGTWQTITKTDPTQGVITNTTKLVAGIASLAIGAKTGVWNWTTILGMLDVFTSKANLSQDQKNLIKFFQLTGKLADGIYEYDESWKKVKNAKDSADAFKKLLTSYNDFLSGSMGIGLGVESPKSVNNITAVARLEGTWHKSDEYAGGAFAFSTPGSKNSENNLEENINNLTDAHGNILPEYPAYNEILGTFALIKKPTIKAHDSVYSIMVTDPVWGTIPEAHLKRTIWIEDDLIYAFNPVFNTDQSKTVIKAAFEIVNTIELPPTASPQTFALDELHNFEKTPNTFRYITPLVPIACLKDLVARYHGSILPALVNEKHVVRLKIFIEQVSTDVGSNGNNNRSTKIFTYPVNIDKTTQFDISNPRPMGSFINLSGAGTAANITLSGNITFPPGKVIFATNGVIITSGSILTGDPANPTKIIAGSFIDIQTNVTIGPGIDLIISSVPFACSPVISPQTHTFVKQFCNNQVQNLTYKGHIHASKKEDEVDKVWEAEQLEKNRKTNKIYFSELYPNPASGITTLELLSPEAQNGVITITTMAGQVIKTMPVTLAMFENRFRIDVSDMAAGVYFVDVKTDYNTLYETSRLIVIK